MVTALQPIEPWPEWLAESRCSDPLSGSTLMSRSSSFCQKLRPSSRFTFAPAVRILKPFIESGQLRSVSRPWLSIATATSYG